ncbi:TetR/AcrR family transcriptional regulator [Anaerobacillus alkaliphilus]|uniref:TetR/AcrR family transcriptional regulator n=1 Tax=Anaerobacillus alkaliphilus TaxID=1548597 RepID=A0A4Q0VXT4_9BACI|nr:TetR/AcrR family transcriptional regulator C-terminal domain-containing protein [Anaerobacillus alkaliphilus]RXJ04563.1 TetR/AcrR family transcriptional regulator [Anaerobacillus alkaliphilus]
MSEKINYIDRRIVKSKNALKEALISLMKTKDFKEITVKDIVEYAQLNRGTFYKHYQYKENILDEIIDDVTTDLIASYREPYKDKDKVELNQLNSNAVKVFDHVHKYANFYTLIVHSNALTGFQNKICHILKELILNDLTDLIPNGNINKELIASYHSYAIFGMIMEWVNGGFTYSPNYMAEQLLAIVKNGRNYETIKANLGK